jgi:hypothetical protein
LHDAEERIKVMSNARQAVTWIPSQIQDLSSIAK